MKQIQTIMFVAGAVLLLLGAAVMVTGWAYAPYVYCVGAVLVAVVQLANGYKGSDITIKRLRRQQVFGALLLLLTGLFMFTTKHNEWVVCLTVAAVLELYTSWRIPYLQEKDR